MVHCSTVCITQEKHFLLLYPAICQKTVKSLCTIFASTAYRYWKVLLSFSDWATGMSTLKIWQGMTRSSLPRIFFFRYLCFLHVVNLHDCPVHHSAWNNRESSCYSVFNNSEPMQDKTGIINKSWCMYLSYFLFTCKIFVISEIYKCKRELWAFSDSQGYMYLISLTCIRWNIKNYSK